MTKPRADIKNDAAEECNNVKRKYKDNIKPLISTTIRKLSMAGFSVWHQKTIDVFSKPWEIL